ncbi:hypothetical protein [Pseudomonas sp. 25 R 14]|nr:hypothetical protein [Pseudomonas sp. 25 R 14]
MQQQRGDGAGGEAGQAGPEVGQASARQRCGFFERDGLARQQAVGNHDLIDLRVVAADPIADRLMPEPPPTARMMAEYQAIGIVLTGTGHQGFGDFHARQCGGIGAELFGQGQGFHRAQVALGAAPLGRGDMDDNPVGLQFLRQARRFTHQAFIAGITGDTDQQPFAGRPQGLDRLFAAVHAHLRVDPVGRAPQGQLAQCQQVALAEKMP